MWVSSQYLMTTQIFQSIKPGSNFKDLDSFALDIYTKRFMDKEGAYTAIPKEFPLIEHLALLVSDRQDIRHLVLTC
jgi:hypothetical protein